MGAPFYLTTLLDAADKLAPICTRSRTCWSARPRSRRPWCERAQAAGFRPYRCYGSNRAPDDLLRICPADSLEDRAQTEGALLAGVEVQIVDEDGRGSARGRKARILSRGPDQFICYTDPAANAAVLTPAAGSAPVTSAT